MFIKKYWQEILLVAFVLIAAVLRFWDITKLQFFTYDQARDALFIKRMLVDHQWRLLGTQTSLPGMYLPPFYFYTILPVLWLSKLNPVGIDIYSAFVGVLTVPLAFYVANKIFGRPAGVFSAGLFAVSPIVVELTRRAWNCNTMPFYILIAFYFVYMYFKEHKLKYFLLSFAFYGYCLSLHFGAWTLIPLFIFIWLYGLIKGKVKALGLLGGLGIMIFFISPLLIFELKHNFFLVSQAKMFFFDGGHIGVKPGVNIIEAFTSSLIALFTVLISGKISVGYGAPLDFSAKVKDLFSLNQPVSVVAQKPFSISIYWWGFLIFFLIILFSIFKIVKGRKQKLYSDNELLGLELIWIWTLWGIFVSRLYSGFFAFFYYLYLFPVPVLLFSYVLKKGWDKKYLNVLVWSLFFFIIIFHLKFTTIFQQNWRNIDDLRSTAKIISENSESGRSFNIATIQRESDRWDRNAVDYRYFVETFYGKKALDWQPQDYKNAEILFIVDETGKSDPLNSPIMEILEFNPKQVINKWKIEKGVAIYKLGK